MTTKFSPALDVPLIEKHPKNPRRRATADPELVESIRTNGLIQPVVVAPLPLPEAKPGMGVPMQRYILIAGHRRLDGAKKAKLKTIPAVIRDDLVTEGQQLEAMLIENGRREDLTPIEEAEGYAQLQLFGYKQKDIAKAVGRDPKTVASRLRLVKLAKSTKDRVHKGQMTLEDALAVVEFADDPETTKRLEKAAAGGTSWSLKHELDLAKKARKYAREAADLAADLKARGIPEIVIGADQDIDDVLPGGRSIYTTGFRDPADHDGCLRWEQGQPTYYSNGVTYYCAAPASHYGQLSTEEKARREAAEQAKEAREKAAAEAAAAEQVRTATVIDALSDGGFSAPLRDLVRGLLPMTVAGLSGTARRSYQGAVGLRDEDRWDDVWGLQRNTAQARMQATRLAGHIEDLTQISDAGLARALVAALVARAEDNLQNGHARNDALAVRYLDLLEQLGHEPCPVDEQLRDDLTDTKEKAS